MAKFAIRNDEMNIHYWSKGYCRAVSLLVLITVSISVTAQSTSTAISYQGALDIAGLPATGQYDFRAVLYDSLEFGNQASPVVAIDDVDVSEGLVNLSLDFGVGVFNSNQRFIQIEVRDGDSAGNYTILQPRQEIFSTPRSITTDMIRENIMQMGTIGDCSVAASVNHTGSISFPSPFSSVPIVFLSEDESVDNFGCFTSRITERTKTGFSWTTFNAATVDSCDCIHWLAIGPP